MKILKAVLVVGVLCLVFLPSQAHATVCTNTVYSTTMTCVTAMDFIGNNQNCGTTWNSTITVANVGDGLFFYVDNGGTSTGNTTAVTTNRSAAATIVATLTNTPWNGATPADTDSLWEATSTSTGALNVTVACGGQTYEVYVWEIHSSVGTPTLDCASSGAPGTAWAYGNSITSLSSTCTSAHKGIAFTGVDWNNVEPTKPTGSWALMNDVGTEFPVAVEAVSGAGAVTPVWTEGSADNLAAFTVVYNDGSSSKIPGQFPRSN